ncbi:MAG: hypothetical protein COV31_03120 [Candidatus Yanofskybacteria bacterium CG10_big_fil_rev_8_21_14_0_10_46_23]|uniref:Methenyltetrahydrofolate cyclohydrolase n=1 Tax=Candidatus Yanofskybacteria bacterium CG10_big_fil_rev_8_21_14_0_10_46_23 TaxID=1975098 RepID=A0A2H0R3M7_9BACT|nr:MAG: hypothetical protein COV31_03120 [Candidatus Yanofskybacteria bacterium CG10_big_fil_rev_8_21_14_0_10_46_23]
MIIDGNSLAQIWLKDLKHQITRLSPLSLGIVLVGDDLGSKIFIQKKKAVGESLGVAIKIYSFDKNISIRDLQKEIKIIVASVSGLIIQLPLPGFEAEDIVNLIPVQKDVDALGAQPIVLAPAVLVVERLMKEFGFSRPDLKIAVFGQGQLIGQPVTKWAKSKGWQVSPIDIDTPHPEALSVEADVVISGVGQPNLITAKMIKAGALVIDFGFSRENNQIKGDVDFQAIESKAIVTPTPGGTGPLVVAAVFQNLINLNK